MGEDKKEEETKADDKGEEDDDDAMDTEAPKAELTENEKKINFYPQKIHDLTESVMASSYADFTIPRKDEGFDDVRFEWQKEETSLEYLNKWRKEKKIET